MLSTKLNSSYSPSGWDFIIIYDNLDGKTFFFFSVNDDNLATTGKEFSSYTLLSYTYKQLFFWATETQTNNITYCLQSGRKHLGLDGEAGIDEKMTCQLHHRYHPASFVAKTVQLY